MKKSVTFEGEHNGLVWVSLSYPKVHILHGKYLMDEIYSWQRHPNLEALFHQTKGCEMSVYPYLT
jgi:hypothetical protein